MSESESERSEGDVCRSPQDYIKEIQIKRKGAEEKSDNIQEEAASEQHLSRWNILNLQSKKSRKDGQDDQLQQTNITFFMCLIQGVPWHWAHFVFCYFVSFYSTKIQKFGKC